MDPARDAIPTFDQIVRIAPVSVIVCGLVFFGWWLRGESVDLIQTEANRCWEFVQ